MKQAIVYKIPVKDSMTKGLNSLVNGGKMPKAEYNDLYKKLVYMAHIAGAPEPMEIFKSQGITVTTSQLQSWRVSRMNRQFRPISERHVNAFADGIINFFKEVNSKTRD